MAAGGAHAGSRVRSRVRAGSLRAMRRRTTQLLERHELHGRNVTSATSDTSCANEGAPRTVRNERHERYERTKRPAGGSGQGHPRETTRGLSDTYVRECPLTVASPILRQMGSRAGRRRVRMEINCRSKTFNIVSKEGKRSESVRKDAKYNGKGSTWHMARMEMCDNNEEICNHAAITTDH